MAVSSIKVCWYKFSSRIRDYLDVIDSYYRPADELNGHSQLSRIANRISAAGDHVVGNHNKRHPNACSHKQAGSHSKRHPNACNHKQAGNQRNHQHNHPHHHNCLAIDSNRNQISSSDQLPPGYSKRETSEGQVYFVDPNGHKYWYDPSVPKELLRASLDLNSLVGRLPSTWEIRQTSSGKTYYVNHIEKTTQFTDPRLVAHKDHLLNIVKHIKCAKSNNNNNTTTSITPTSQNVPLISGNPSQRSHIARASSRLSPEINHQSRANSTPRNTCSHQAPRHRHHDSSLRRHLFAVLEEARNSHNHQYQLNLLSSSHHNLSTMTQHSNTLDGRLPGWFPSTANQTTGPFTSRKQKVSSNNSNQHETAPAPSANTTSETNHHSRSMNRSGSTNNLYSSANNLAPSEPAAYPPRTNKELFDKISILRQELLKQQVIAHPCRIDISRKRIFEESFRVVSQVQPRDLKKRLLVKFRGEEGLDYGGVAREWFYLLSREILNPVHGLFQYTSDDIYNLQINPDSGIVYREHLLYMNFCGRVIGMAVFHGHFIEGHFTLPFYKMLLRKSINLGDIELVDPELHRSLCWILENDITNVIDTTFLVQHNAFGELQEHELKENGRNIVVTEENKREYVSLYVNYRCRRGISKQFEALQRGFYELISPSLLENFDEHELELLIGGLSKINIEDWKLHTKLKNCTVDTPLVKWFWELVKSYSEERRARLLQFVTGSPRVPIQGFKALQGVNAELRLFTIHLIKNACTDNLPKSHTCFNRIDLPPYESYEKLRDKLTQAIEETMGFAMQ